MKICKSCGQAVKRDAKFCPYCGITVTEKMNQSKKKQYLFIIRWISIITIVFSIIFIIVMVWPIGEGFNHASIGGLELCDQETFNETSQNDLNVIDHNYKIKNIYYWGDEEDFIAEDEQFWVKVEHTLDDGRTSDEYILTDTSAHIYRVIENDVLNMDKELSAIISLPNGRTALGYTEFDEGYNYRIFADTDQSLTDVSDQFLDEDETIWYILKDDNGIKIFTYKTIDSYSYQDIIINVYDGYLNKTSLFSKSELSDRYGYDLKSMLVGNLFLIPIGGNIYCMMPNSSNEALFIDTARNKVFVIETAVKSLIDIFNDNSSISSDGDYILCSGQFLTSIIDIDYEMEVLNIRQGFKSHGIYRFSAIREGKFFGYSVDVGYYYSHLFDYMGNQIAMIDYEGSVLSNYSLFYNGYAVLELENSGGVTFVTMIDDKGNWLFEPISGKLGERATYIEELDCFLIFSNDGMGGYLLNTQGVQQRLASIPNESGLFFHLTSINGEYRIIYFDKQSEMLLSTKEVISVD